MGKRKKEKEPAKTIAHSRLMKAHKTIPSKPFDQCKTKKDYCGLITMCSTNINDMILKEDGLEFTPEEIRHMKIRCRYCDKELDKGNENRHYKEQCPKIVFNERWLRDAMEILGPKCFIAIHDNEETFLKWIFSSQENFISFYKKMQKYDTNSRFFIPVGCEIPHLKIDLFSKKMIKECGYPKNPYSPGYVQPVDKREPDPTTLTRSEWNADRTKETIIIDDDTPPTANQIARDRDEARIVTEAYPTLFKNFLKQFNISDEIKKKTHRLPLPRHRS